MNSSDNITKLNQSYIKIKMQHFLTCLGEALPDWALEGGLCNGYSFMMMRADMLGEADKYIKRLKTLATADSDEIEKMATLLKEYRLQYQLAEKVLKDKLKECKHDTARNDIRKAHHAQLQKQLYDKFSDNDRQILAYAQELYAFISSLLFSYDPSVVKLRMNERYVEQDDYLSILKVLSPDQFLQSLDDKSEFPIKKVLGMDFNFTESELIDTLDKAIKDEDFVSIYYSSHIIYITKKAGVYTLYDPNSKEGPVDYFSCKEMVPDIKKLFFANIIGWVTAKYLPIGFNIYVKNTHVDLRPTAKELLNHIFKNRGASLEVNAQGWSDETALYLAAKRGNAEIVRELLERKADPYIYDSLGGTAILLAAGNDHVNVLKIMDEFKISFDKKNKSHIAPLHMAATWGHVNAIRFLIEKKVDVNVQDEKGWTPIIYAAKDGYADAVDLLASHGANLQLENSDNLSAALMAAKHGHIEVLKTLTKYGVNLNKADKDGFIPLSSAAHYGQLGAVKFLAEQKQADINIKIIQSGNTPLHRAAAAGHQDVVAALIELKADMTIENKQGMTPVLLAAQNGKADVVALFLKYLNKSGSELFMLAATRGYKEVVQFFLTQRSEDVLLALLNAKNYKDIHDSIKSMLLKQRKLMVKTFIQFVSHIDEIDKRKMWVKRIRSQENILGVLLNTQDTALLAKLSRLFEPNKFILEGQPVTESIFEIVTQLTPMLIPQCSKNFTNTL